MTDGESTGLVWLDGVPFGQVADWRVGYVDPDEHMFTSTTFTARSAWLGPGGALVFKVGDDEVFAGAYSPSGWDTVKRVEGTTRRQEKRA